MAYRYPSLYPSGCSGSSRPCSPNKISKGGFGSGPSVWLSVTTTTPSRTTLSKGTFPIRFPYSSTFGPSTKALTTLPSLPSTDFTTVLLNVGKTYNITAVITYLITSDTSQPDFVSIELALNTNSVDNTATSIPYGVPITNYSAYAPSASAPYVCEMSIVGQWTLTADETNKYINLSMSFNTFDPIVFGALDTVIQTVSLQITQL